MAPIEIDQLRIPDHQNWDYPPDIISTRLLKFAGETTASRVLEVIKVPQEMTIYQMKEWLVTEGGEPANAAELIAFALRATESRNTPLPVIAAGSSCLITQQSDTFEMYPTMITMLGLVDWVVGAVARPPYFDKKLERIVTPPLHVRTFSTHYHVLVRV